LENSCGKFWQLTKFRRIWKILAENFGASQNLGGLEKFLRNKDVNGENKIRIKNNTNKNKIKIKIK
jgi:hypothetical protein